VSAIPDGQRNDDESTARPSYPGLDGRKRGTLVGPLAAMVAGWEQSLRSPLTGVTADGTAELGLFPLGSAGAPTSPITKAAADLVASLDPTTRAEVERPLDSDDWRRWSNFAPNLVRHGALLEGLPDVQREHALELMRQTLSAAGFETARNIMRLNHTLAEMTGHGDDYGEWLYWLSIFGTPSPDRPWGWQIDGHHLVLNTFVLGDQIVTTPMFWGSEPTVATTGTHAGTVVLQEEQRQGYALLQSLTAAQRSVAVLSDELPSEVIAGSFRDNFEMRYEGIAFGDLTADQQALLRRLVEVYIGRIRPDHAAVKMAEIDQHLERTFFAWIGGTGIDAVFYYRIHSPVVLIEFDHLPGIAFMNTHPTRRHIHTVVRTPNGNDYGQDLLRQHYEQAHQTRTDRS